jgi:putative glutamine amidotransferase
MPRPRIAITSSAPESPEGENAPYLAALRRAGGEPVLVSNDAARLDEILASVRGVVLSGGVDVDVARYGGNPSHSRAQRYRCDRDEFEIALARATRERGVPTLAICRGLQVANVAFGGTLVEDLRDDLDSRYVIEHRQTYESGLDRADYAHDHDVRVVPESALARIVRKTTFRTNSMHHQALRALGDGFVAVAHTHDGVIEAVDATFRHPYYVGVQWHPEELDDEPSARLFRALIDAASSLR